MWSASTASRDFTQSCSSLLVHYSVVDRIQDVSYLLVDIPTPVGASLLCFGTPLLHLEMPVHVSSSLLVPLYISLEASAAFSAGRT